MSKYDLTDLDKKYGKQLCLFTDESIKVGDKFICGDEIITITDVYVCDTSNSDDYGCVSEVNGKIKSYFDIKIEDMYKEKWLKIDD